MLGPIVTPLDVAEVIAQSQAMDEDEAKSQPNAQGVVVEGTPYDEIEHAIHRVPDVPTIDKAVERTAVLVDVLHKYLIPCLVATPLVYMSDESWEFHNHAEFRSSRRKELQDLTAALKANAVSENIPVLLPTMLDTLEKVFLDVLKVRLPAMPNIYLTENFYDSIPVKEGYGELVEKIMKNKKMDVRTRVYGLSQILVQFLLLCPMGRPQVYINDTEWKLESERVIRAQLRELILKR